MLQTRDLSLRYHNGKLALSRFDVAVGAGELVIVLGGNGSGKTTLLRCIARTLTPSTGEVWVNGTNLVALKGEQLRRARLALAMISQHASLVRRRNVLANVATGALGRLGGVWSALGGLPACELEAAYSHLAEVGLADLALQRADTLSGGQAQRVAIARALAQRPRVLLADEPVASLDPEAAEDIMRLLRRLAAEENLAVLCVLHQVELAYAYADRGNSRRRHDVRPTARRAFARDRAPPLSQRSRMTEAAAPARLGPRDFHRGGTLVIAKRIGISLILLLILVQSLIVVEARPKDLVTGVHGMADIIRRAMPPDFQKFGSELWPALETIDIAIFGTVGGVVLAIPLALLAAANVSPSRPIYYGARGVIGFARAVPDLVWALFFVTAVGLGPFPGGLALAVHSVGMLGWLFAETIEQMDMAPIDALSLTGARRIQVFTHGVVPSVLPSLLGITLYRLDENIRSSLVLGFVGAGGIGFQLLTAMNLFQYREVSLLLIITFVIVQAAERLSAILREKIS